MQKSRKLKAFKASVKSEFEMNCGNEVAPDAGFKNIQFLNTLKYHIKP